MVVEETGQRVGDSGGGSSDDHGLKGAAQPASTYQFSFQCSEDGECEQRDDDGEFESREVVCYEHVGQQRDEAASDVRDRDGEGGAVSAICGGLLEAELEPHHEVDPGSGVLLEGCEHGLCADTADGVLLEDLVDLFFFVAGAFDDLALFALTFGDVVFGITASGEIATEAHRDRACSDLCKTGEDDDVRRGDGTGETSSEGEGNGESVGEPDDDIANELRGFEVAFDVGAVGVGRVGYLMHSGSVVQGLRRKASAARGEGFSTKVFAGNGESFAL